MTPPAQPSKGETLFFWISMVFVVALIILDVYFLPDVPFTKAQAQRLLRYPLGCFLGVIVLMWPAWLRIRHGMSLKPVLIAQLAFALFGFGFTLWHLK